MQLVSSRSTSQASSSEVSDMQANCITTEPKESNPYFTYKEHNFDIEQSRQKYRSQFKFIDQYQA